MNFVIELNEDEYKQIINITHHVCASPSESPDLFCQQVKEISHLIPERIRLWLCDFALRGSPYSGYLLCKGCDTLDTTVVPTPPNNLSSIGETTTLAKIQAIFMSVLGDMIAYEAEGRGRLFQDVVPVESMANDQCSIGSNAELEIHTEQAFSRLRPDFLSLACIRGDDDAFTYILPLQTLLENMSASELELIQKPLWYTSVDLSFKLNGHDFIEGDMRGPMPILDNETGQFIFDQDLMRGTDEVSNNLLQKIIDLYFQHRIQHCLQPGEIIFIDNRTSVHGRSPFFPKYDEYDRFLIRCFATLDYQRSSYARIEGGRTIAAKYS
jgi:L-asparagine oxygenase